MLIVVAAALLALAACGETEATPSPPTAAAEPAAATTTSQAAVTTTTSTSTTVLELPPAACGDTELSQPPDTVITFYAQCDGSGTVPFPIYRPGRTTPTLEQSLAALVGGTTPAEREVGLHTGFDALDGAADVHVLSSIGADGVATIALRKDEAAWRPDTAWWSSDQLNSLVDPLLATVFGTEEVRGLDMSSLCFEQIACDRIVTRAEWAGMLFTNAGVLLHGGCTPEFAWWHPEQCTVDGILAEGTVAATVANVGADDTLNVRAGPGTEHFIIGELANRASVRVTREAAAATDGGIWRLVDAGPSGLGWVNEAFLAMPRTAAETLVDAFVRFALDPTDVTFADLPLADTVDLGLGPTIMKAVPARDLRQKQAWVLEADYFRAYSGPFSVFDALRLFDVYDVTTGEHAHCASPPVPPPEQFEDMERISVQPRLGLHSSCLMWRTVDFFVLPTGEVAAITLDIWEP
jgi:hypothetical protein